MVPSSLMTNTEFSLTLVEAESLATIPKSEIVRKNPVTTRKMAIPQTVASVILKNCFIIESFNVT